MWLMVDIKDCLLRWEFMWNLVLWFVEKVFILIWILFGLMLKFCVMFLINLSIFWKLDDLIELEEFKRKMMFVLVLYFEENDNYEYFG